MAPRKKAGPNVGSFRSYFDIRVRDDQWRAFAAAIDSDLSANVTILPNGMTLRDGLQQSIALVLICVGGPTTREIRADLRRGVARLNECYQSMIPETRDLFNQAAAEWPEFIPYLKHIIKNAAAELRETEEEVDGSASLDQFLTNIIWLVGHCPEIRRTLPSKAHYETADAYAIFRSARAAVKIACQLAERHVPSAAPKLKRLRNCTPSTFLSKLMRARRGFPLLSMPD